MTPEDAPARVEKLFLLCDSEKWTALESVYATAMAYVIMCKTLGEQDKDIIERVLHVTNNVQVSIIREVH